MNTSELNATYNNTLAAGDFPHILKEFQDRSIETYNKYNWISDLIYEDKAREMLHIKNGSTTLIAVGACELEELVRHSTDYAIACEAAGENIGLMHVPKATHFSMLNDLANPDG
jgi:hypothetical protein